MHIPVFLLFPILVLANPAPISPAPKNPLGSLQARSANYCCHPFPPGSNSWRLCGDGTFGTPCCGYGNQRRSSFSFTTMKLSALFVLPVLALANPFSLATTPDTAITSRGDQACCKPWAFAGPKYNKCEDGTTGTPCCGYGKCNGFCCACKGGCRRAKA
ncbi:hypothetical protein H112_00609 [Trichophyton rubrum D6]|uniref:Uncharacterized protein n=2 Tax=Trichophyton rubrum TaxID=5551 RepID=F2T084_TRIRC|nr:uncharacterized protein TERG_08980 [Trichophyton rubrum CBS 118892]EZF27516.1 hypothetical protein H100_00609 [Trichophyton rubrum MR850]EZF46454.1 hypothetical protein H102_00608 [Trichophyton rubrum CBS 100081]EZF57203.1 hypothetical protein H103_00610 [Trichophyton rubrum CBS 288.86]EZF67771.1 hypothetical protein H104_00597 [Trichophyton rubrum CBS 289.86]EZF89002.1 hypothetical protein H110_00614 [Trichophyton rubrum MR1448]EZF99798.1 hypothetical protein H113_00614 [Trichophyton rubr